MSKGKGNIHAVETPVVDAPVAQPVETTATVEAPATANYTLTYRRQHPGGGVLGRCSYGIAGVSGIVVFDMTLFKDNVAPATITLDVELAQPKAKATTAKAEAAALKLAERAAKAQARVEAQTAKALERAAAAQAKLDAAKAKVAAAEPVAQS